MCESITLVYKLFFTLIIHRSVKFCITTKFQTTGAHYTWWRIIPEVFMCTIGSIAETIKITSDTGAQYYSFQSCDQLSLKENTVCQKRKSIFDNHLDCVPTFKTAFIGKLLR